MNEYFYLENDVSVVKIKATRRPGPKTKPRSGTWVVWENFEGRTWTIGVCPEITWGTLSKLEYIGKRKVQR